MAYLLEFQRIFRLLNFERGVLQRCLQNLLLALLLLNIILLAVEHKLRSNYCRPNYYLSNEMKP